MYENAFKMIVTDLDGTYLRNDKSISEYSRNIVNALRKKGYIFVVATARPVRSVVGIDNLDFDAGIFHNGAVIYNKKELIGNFGISNAYSIIKKIVSEYTNLNIAVESNDVLYANFDASQTWPETHYIFTNNFFEIQGAISDKIIVEVTSIDDMNRIKKFLTNDLYIQLSENRVAMIMNKKANKVFGVQRLANLYKIAMEDIVAFGDDYNDIEMLKAVGMGIAVNNALDEVKDIADKICGNNDVESVAKCLSEYL